MVNNTYCITCNVISKGYTCNSCGDKNVPAHDYNENGFRVCPNCGQQFKYSVGRCSTCQQGGE